MGWETAYDPVLATDIGSTGERNYRNVIRANTSSYSGSQIRISVTAAAAGAAVLDGTSIGVMTTGEDFDSAPTRITWVDAGGGNGMTIPAGTTEVSDEITFDFDKTVRHGVHFYLANRINFRYVVAGHDDYYHVTGGGDQTLLEDATYSLADNDTVCLDLLEVFEGEPPTWIPIVIMIT